MGQLRKHRRRVFQHVVRTTPLVLGLRSVEDLFWFFGLDELEKSLEIDTTQVPPDAANAPTEPDKLDPAADLND